MSKKVIQVDVPETAQRIPRAYEGYAFVSDIDKTYLATQIDTISGLLRAAFETAERKSNIPGFSIILRAIRRGGQEEPQRNPLFFVSASPPQIGKKVLSKMDLDGIDHDGIIFKNQIEYVKRGNFKKLKEQIAYKLGALLSLWEKLPEKTKLVLFGDDSESDAVIFSLFAEILAKHVEGKKLVELLQSLGVFEEESLRVAWLARQMCKEPRYPVQAAFINLETGSNPGYYGRYGPFIYATENSLQVALALYERELIREQAVRSVGREMVLKFDVNPRELLESLEVGGRRGIYSLSTLDKVWPMLHAHGVLPPPVERASREGAVTPLNPRRWSAGFKRVDLNSLKLRYNDEGRY